VAGLWMALWRTIETIWTAKDSIQEKFCWRKPGVACGGEFIVF